MTRPLGKHQRARLAVLGTPTMLQVVADSVTCSLCRRGLARELKPGAFVGITPAGLRRLADELEAGRIEQKLPEAKGTR